MVLQKTMTVIRLGSDVTVTTIGVGDNVVLLSRMGLVWHRHEMTFDEAGVLARSLLALAAAVERDEQPVCCLVEPGEIETYESR